MGKLHGARFKVEYEVIVKDKNGKVLSRQKGVSKSLLANFVRWLRALFRQTVPVSYHTTDNLITDVGGASRSVFCTNATSIRRDQTVPYAGSINAPDNIDTYGLMVGSGTTSVTPDDYNLATKIVHGTGALQLDYDTHTIEAVEIVGSVSRFRVSRSFKNLSGASVTVREIGIAIQLMYVPATQGYFLVCRDVLVSPTTVPDGASLTVRYRFSVTA